MRVGTIRGISDETYYILWAQLESEFEAFHEQFPDLSPDDAFDHFEIIYHNRERDLATGKYIADKARQKIEKAFMSLRRGGYIAEADHWCCQSCGVSVIPDEYEDKYVFFHDQDAENLYETGSCHLSFAGDGNLIISHMKAAGLDVVWDGDMGKRIKISDSSAVHHPMKDFEERFEALFLKSAARAGVEI